jgi:hypothetical protein
MNGCNGPPPHLWIFLKSGKKSHARGVLKRKIFDTNSFDPDPFSSPMVLHRGVGKCLENQD